MQPGDIFVVRENHPFDVLIRFAQRRRFAVTDAEFNHCGIISTASGETIEALWSGVSYGSVHNYPDRKIISIPDDATRFHILQWSAKRVGDRYSFVSLFVLVLSLMVGAKFRFGRRGTYICSGLVASALTYAGIDMGDDPEWVVPAEIAMWSHANNPLADPVLM